MKNLYAIPLLLAAALSASQTAEARIITPEEAHNKAIEFLNHKQGSSSRKLVRLRNTDKSLNGATLDSRLYIYNLEGDNGFVVVSAIDDDGIVGYSDEGRFDFEAMPENAKATFSSYAETADYEIAENEYRVEVSVKGEVKPLLGKIAFNQSAPYNDQCPDYSATEKCVTGCTATTMAQIMKYYQYPTSGIGSNSYVSETNGYDLSMNFSKVRFDWKLILDTYKDGNYTAAQAAEVAKLMSATGISINTDYDLSSSSNQIKQLTALRDNWGYNPYIQRITRDYISEERFYKLLTEELKAGRPVSYSAVSDEGGHSFICDGYNQDGYFHINWGWNGYCNGYYNLNILCPTNYQQEESGADGYSGRNNLGIGIMPATISQQSEAPFMASLLDVVFTSDSILSVKDTLEYTVQILNSGLTDMNYEAGCILTSPDGTVTASKYGTRTDGLKSNYYQRWGRRRWFTTSSADGDYIEEYYVKPLNSEDTIKLCAPNGKYNYMTYRVSNGKVTRIRPACNASLTLTGKISSNSFIRNQYSGIEIPLKNSSSDKSFNSYLTVGVLDSDNKFKSLETKLVMLAPGESRNIIVYTKIPETLTASSYRLVVGCDKTNNYKSGTVTVISPSSNNYQTMTVSTSASTEPVLALTSPISGQATQEGELSVDLSIKNTGARYYGYIYANVYNASTGEYIKNIKTARDMIDKNETKKYTLSNSEMDLPSGRYRIVCRAAGDWLKYNSSTSRLTIDYIATGIAEVKTDEDAPVIIYENGKLNINADQQTEISIYTISGSCIYKGSCGQVAGKTLNKGVYIGRINGRSYKIAVK